MAIIASLLLCGEGIWRLSVAGYVIYYEYLHPETGVIYSADDDLNVSVTNDIVIPATTGILFELAAVFMYLIGELLIVGKPKDSTSDPTS